MSLNYVVAGGGAYGHHYLRKLDSAVAKKAINIDGVIVVDKNPECAVAEESYVALNSRLEVTSWRDFGQSIWEDRDYWVDSVWVPAPIAPHILAQWVTDRLLATQNKGAVPKLDPIHLPDIPYAKSLPDGRVLLSHAPGTCPLNCIEPAVCAITHAERWWEMGETIDSAFTNNPSTLSRDSIAMFFCKHHCDAGENDVGGIRFRTIYDEYDRIESQVMSGQTTVGIATFSSCHGILNVYEMVNSISTKICTQCSSEFWCNSDAEESACWCMRMAQLKNLDSSRDCFCPDCLQQQLKQQDSAN